MGKRPKYGVALRKKLIIKIPEDLHKEFKDYCRSKGITMTDVIIKCIKQKLDKRGK